MKHRDTLTADLFGGLEGTAASIKPPPPPAVQPQPAPIPPPTQPRPPLSISAQETQARERLRAQRETPKPPPQAPVKPPLSINQQHTTASIAPVSQPATPPQNSPASTPPMAQTHNSLAFPLAAFIACGCFTLSAINTYLFLLQSGKPLPLAVLTAVLTTAFSGAAFHFGKTYRNPLCYALTAGIIAFSVFVSIAVSYDHLKTQELTSATAREYLQETATLRAVNAQELETTRAEITRLTQRIADLHSQADYWKSRSWNCYDAAQAGVAAVEARINDLQAWTTALQAEAKHIATRDSTTAQVAGIPSTLSSPPSLALTRISYAFSFFVFPRSSSTSQAHSCSPCSGDTFTNLTPAAFTAALKKYCRLSVS